jgi:HK97 family phage portal protein
MAFYVKVGNFHWGWGREAYTQNAPLTPTVLNMSGRPEWSVITNENAYTMYLTTPEVYSVIRRRGFMLAAGIWKHYRVKRDGTAEEIKKSPVVELLENPNPLMSGNDFLRQWSENELVHGNNYMSLIYGLDGEARSLQDAPSAIHNLPPNRMEIRTTGKIFRQTRIEDIIEEYRLRLDGVPSYDIYTVDEILHSKNISGKNPIQGESPLITLYMEIGNIRSAKEFRNVIMTKKGALGMLTNKAATGNGAIPITEEERRRLEKQYRAAYGIGEDQIQVMITQSALEWQAMSYPTKDLMLFEEISADFRTIIDLYGLNDMLFSKEKGATFTNLRDGFKHAFQVTTIPEAEEKAMSMSKKLGLVEKGQFLQLEYDHLPILQRDEKEKAEELNLKANAVQKLQTSGIYTDDEIKNIARLEE